MAANAEAPNFFRVKHQGSSPVRPGVVENLVEQGRIPVLDEIIESTYENPDFPYGNERSRRVFFCYVPSPDSRLGDATGYFAGVRIFQSPSGEMRREPDMFTLTPSQAKKVQERIAAAKESLR